MRAGRAKQSVINVCVGILYRVIATILPFVCRTVIIYKIGIGYLGLDSLFTSILSVLSVSDLGFGSVIIYSMYRPYSEGDNEKVKAILFFYRRIYKIVGLFILGAGLLLLPHIEWFIAEGTVYPEDVDIYVVYLIFLLNSSLTYLLFDYKQSVLVVTMRNDVDSMINLIRSIVLYSLQITVVLLFKNYYLYILLLPVVTAVTSIARSIYIDRVYPQFAGKSMLSQCDQKDIVTRVGALIGNRVGSVALNSMDSLVISKFLGLTVLAQYTNYYTVFYAVFTIESVIYDSIQSAVGNSLVEKSKESNYLLFKDLFLFNTLMTMAAACCFTSLYQPFMTLWVGETNVLNIEIPLLLSFVFYLKSIRKPQYTFYEAAGLWKTDFLKPYISVIVHLAAGIILVQIIGLPGIVVSAILALAVIELPWEARVLFRYCLDTEIAEYRGMVFSSFSVCGIAFVFTFLLCSYLPYGIAGIILRLAVIAVVCGLITLLILKFTQSGKRVCERIRLVIRSVRQPG